MSYAVVDIGSNTVKINEFNADMLLGLNKSKPVGLINYVTNQKMSESGINALIEILNEYKSLADTNNINEVFYIATASLRGITNQSEVLSAVQKETGIDIEIISSGDEALYSFEGLKHNLGTNVSSGVMIDMGGGSTEIVGFRNGEIENLVSLPFGCLSLYKNFVSDILPTGIEIESINHYIDSEIYNHSWLKSYNDNAYLIGGTARAFENLTISITKYDDLIELFDKVKSDINLLNQVVPERLTTIIPGLTAFCRLLRYIGTHNITVTHAGIREGYLVKKLSRR